MKKEKTRNCSTGLETGCKPVLFHLNLGNRATDEAAEKFEREKQFRAFEEDPLAFGSFFEFKGPI